MNESSPPLEHLVAFLDTVHHGSFAAAARAQGRDPSVLSRHVAALEGALGVRLLERSTRRCVPTATGREYADRIGAALDLIRQANLQASDARARIAGQIKVAVPPAFGRMYVTSYASAFVSRYPQVRLELQFADRQVDMIAEGVDLAVRLGELADSSLVARRVRTYSHRLYASPAYLAARGAPGAPGELAEHRLLEFPATAPHARWSLTCGSKRASVPLSAALRMNDGSAVLEAAEDGAGIALLGEWLAQPACRAGRLVRVLDGWTTGDRRAVWIVTASRRGRPATVREFARGLTAHLKAQLAA